MTSPKVEPRPLDAEGWARLLAEVVDGDYDAWTSDPVLYRHPGNVAQRQHYIRRAELLMAAPEKQAHDAARWQEGYDRAKGDHLDYMPSVEECAEDTPNPYLSEQP